MTPAQQDALEKIRELFREHFESGVVVCVTDDERETIYHGGIDVAVGLLEITKDRLLMRIREGYEKLD